MSAAWLKGSPPLRDGVVAPQEGPSAHADAPQRVRRGGRWMGFAGTTKASVRDDGAPTARNAGIGARVARSWGHAGDES